MATVYDVPADKLINALASDLRDSVKTEKPEWADFVKTGASKQRKPQEGNWWWARSASILRRVYIDGPVGVQRLRTFYGGKKNRGRKPERFARGSGKVIRTILKQLDEAGLTKADKFGRSVTSKGQSYVDRISSKISQEDV